MYAVSVIMNTTKYLQNSVHVLSVNSLQFSLDPISLMTAKTSLYSESAFGLISFHHLIRVGYRQHLNRKTDTTVKKRRKERRM